MPRRSPAHTTRRCSTRRGSRRPHAHRPPIAHSRDTFEPHIPRAPRAPVTAARRQSLRDLPRARSAWPRASRARPTAPARAHPRRGTTMLAPHRATLPRSRPNCRRARRVRARRTFERTRPWALSPRGGRRDRGHGLGHRPGVLATAAGLRRRRGEHRLVRCFERVCVVRVRSAARNDVLWRVGSHSIRDAKRRPDARRRETTSRRARRGDPTHTPPVLSRAHSLRTRRAALTRRDATRHAPRPLAR